MSEDNSSSHGDEIDCSGSVVEITTTLPSEPSAAMIAGSLLEKRLAACVQILGPITSHYRWQGNLETGQEWKLLIKTTASCTEALCKELRLLHPYETPEILVFPTAGVNTSYAHWVADQCD